MTETLIDPHYARRFAHLLDVAGDHKAELVDGEVHVMSPTGYGPGRAAGAILQGLLRYEDAVGGGEAFGDGLTFMVDLPGRESFSPDAAWVAGPVVTAAAFPLDAIVGAPTFAVEVRSKGDYGRRMEGKLERKREDYFAASTLVVWDVDLIGADVVRAYRPEHPSSPRISRRGETADAEPAVPGWRFAVDALFASLRGRPK